MQTLTSTDWGIAKEAQEPKFEGDTFKPAYPDVYYRIQPYVLAMSDQLLASSNEIPSQSEIERMSDSICSDLCRLYPDMAKMASAGSPYFDQDEAQPVMMPFFRRSRGRGLFKDLIDILLLNEIFRQIRR
jgi:hypothetical protein